MQKPLLVGELNPYGAEPRYALFPYPKNSSGERLCKKIMGLTVAEYMRSFDRVNLCEGKWSAEEARQRVYELRKYESRGTAVLLGAKVCQAFGVAYEPFTVTVASWEDDATLVILPHPSGRCRIWNRKGSYARARRVLREGGVMARVMKRNPVNKSQRKKQFDLVMDRLARAGLMLSRKEMRRRMYCAGEGLKFKLYLDTLQVLRDFGGMFGRMRLYNES